MLSAHRKQLIIVSFAVVIVVVSLLFIYLYVCDEPDQNSLKNAVYVETENDLRNAINNAPLKKHTLIALNKDITLTSSTLSIPADKNITLTSNRVTGYYRLIGAPNYDTITVAGHGVFRLDSITV